MFEKKPLIIENAHLMFRNFSGEKGKYNKDGLRSFSVKIEDPELADRMAADGWNIRVLDPKEEGDPQAFHLPVAVSYEYRPPRVTMIRNGRKIELSLDNIGELDYETIIGADVEINPSEWDVNGKHGIKAYLKRLYIEVEADPFADKYADCR